MISNGAFVAGVYGISLLFLAAAGLNLHYKLNPPRRSRMSDRQAKAEQEAVRLLTNAQKLMQRDDANVTEAMRLRFKATHEVLPQNRMYIIGKHPRSLLKDVDRRIQKAYIRHFRTEFDFEKKLSAAPKYPSLDDMRKLRGQRYGSVAHQESKRMLWYAAALLGLICLFGLLILLMNLFGANAIFQNSFRFLPG